MLKDKIIKNIPNTLTTSRIIASIAGAGAFVAGNIWLAAGLYIYGAVSDFFDGLSARKLNAFSEFGRKLDALSDKIYAGSLLIPSILCCNLIMLIPLALELKISYITLKSQRLGFRPETQRIGKFKTALLFPTMIAGLLSTISIELLPLLWTLLPITTSLQAKSITVYENLLNYNINQRSIKEQKKENLDLEKNTSKDVDREVREVTKEKVSANANVYSYNKSMNLVEELAFYMTTPYFKQEYDNANNSKLDKPYTRIKKIRRLK